MANIKQYRSNAKIPGLPDTTNITDPQLRLFLDRLKLVVTNLTVTVDGLAKYNNVDNIVRDLTNSQYFNSIIDQKVTDISTGIVKSEVKKNNNKKNKIVELDAIEIDPVEMTLNVFNAETASGTAEVYYVPHDTSPMYKGVTWSVSDDTVATIDQNGNVTALAVGKCTITATSNYDDDITAEAFLEVVYADTITVTATYQWCSQNSNVVCFTEIQEPVDGNCIWSATENTVTLLPDKTEEEAKAASAFTTIATADSRKWVSTAYPEWAGGKRFWRDEEKDVEAGFTSHPLVSATITYDGPSYAPEGTCAFAEYGTDAGETGRVFSRAYSNSYAPADVAKQYLIDDTPVLSANATWKRYQPEWQESDGAGWNCLAYLMESPRLYIQRTGRSKVVNGVTWHELASQKWQGRQRTAWVRMPINPLGYDGAYIDTEPNEAGEGYIDDSVSSTGCEWYFEAAGYRYFLNIYSQYFLFSPTYYYAWTLSPCHQTGVSTDQITVYTDPNTLPEDVTTGDGEAGTYPTDIYIPYNQDYEGDGVIDETYWMPEGQVTATGEGTYSITGNNGETYYRH